MSIRDLFVWQLFAGILLGWFVLPMLMGRLSGLAAKKA